MLLGEVFSVLVELAPVLYVFFGKLSTQRVIELRIMNKRQQCSDYYNA